MCAVVVRGVLQCSCARLTAKMQSRAPCSRGASCSSACWQLPLAGALSATRRGCQTAAATGWQR